MPSFDLKKPSLRHGQTGQPMPPRSIPAQLTSHPDAVMGRTSSCACGGGCPRCLARSSLRIGDPADWREREADTLADHVMRMPVPSTQEVGISPTASDIRRETDGKVLRGAGSIRRRKRAPAIVEEVLRSPGQSLDRETRLFMEPRFGHDFSDVRTHTDARAAESALAVGAHAYAVGKDLVFGSGEFSPGTPAGRRLIAHELAHVIQQSGDKCPAPATIQRSVDDETEPVSSDRSRVKKGQPFQAAAAMDVADGRAFAKEAIAVMSAYGATIHAPPSDLVAALEPPSDTSPDVDTDTDATDQVQTSPLEPIVQRSGGGSVKPEAGFVGSLQICYDACNGEISVVGWVWAGGGVVTKGLFGRKAWWGAFVFAEKEFLKTKLDFMPTLNCGTCDPACKPAEDETHWGGGFAGFPVVIKPGEWAKHKQAGIEVGLLLSPRSRCDGSAEVIALVDLTKYLGPVGAAVVAGQDLANKLAKRFNVEIECGIGVNVSGSIHLCKSVPGGGLLGVTSDSAKLCGGGYVGCGIGLAHDKAALPGS